MISRTRTFLCRTALVLALVASDVVAWAAAGKSDGAELWWDGEVRFPLVVMRNVAIFPGVPALLRLKFDAVAHRYQGVPILTARVWTLRTEPEIADALTDAAREWPSVAIGSYPRFELTPHKVLLTLESRDVEALEQCTQRVIEQVDGSREA